MTTGIGAIPSWTRAVVYDASFNRVALIPRIVSASIHNVVNQVSTFQFTVPAVSTDGILALLTHGRVVGLFYQDVGELIRGRISHIETRDGDAGFLTIHCFSLAIELVWQDTYYGIGADNESASAIIDKVLAQVETTWTKVVTGGSYVNLTNEFAPATSWQTLLTLAEMENAYIRETATMRQLEMSQTTVASGLVLLNTVGQVDVDKSINLGSPQPLHGLISSLDVLRDDGQAIINRLVPQGVNGGDIILDLGLSNRSSPYTINNFIADTPRVTNSAVFVENGYNETETTERTLEIAATGQNRAIFVWIILDIPASVVLPYIPTIDGKEGINLASINTGGTNHYLADLYYWRGVKTGTNAIRLRFSSGGSADIKAMAVAVSGVRQNISPIRDSDSAFATTGTSAATPSLTTAVGDLVLGFLLWTSGTASDDAGQTSILDQGGNAPAAQSAKKTADASSETMSWTLSVSQEWAVAGTVIMPALIYYIEDSTSITAKGRRTARFIMNANRFVGAGATDQQNAANTLYDRAVTHLLRSKDGIRHYDIKVGLMPITPIPNVGDTVRVIYRGFSLDGFFVTIDENLIVMERTRTIDAEGTLSYEFKFAPVINQPVSMAELLYKTSTKVLELETTQ